jgi:hypothetical protein
MKTTIILSALLLGASTILPQAAVTSIDFGRAFSSVLFDGTFDGSSSHVAGHGSDGDPSITTSLSDGWSLEVSAASSLFYFQSAEEYTFNAGPPPTETFGDSTAYDESLWTSRIGVGTGDTATFTISGGSATDTVSVEIYTANGYALSFNGSTPETVFSWFFEGNPGGEHSYYDVGSSATGASSYTGSFGDSSFNSDIAAMRITITPVPEPSGIILSALGILSFGLHRKR